MESDSEPASPGQQPLNMLAEIVGTFIALLTLALPFTVVVHYSSGSNPSLTPSYSIQRVK